MSRPLLNLPVVDAKKSTPYGQKSEVALNGMAAKFSPTSMYEAPNTNNAAAASPTHEGLVEEAGTARSDWKSRPASTAQALLATTAIKVAAITAALKLQGKPIRVSPITPTLTGLHLHKLKGSKNAGLVLDHRECNNLARFRGF